MNKVDKPSASKDTISSSSNAETLIWYDLITPFCSSTRGGFHVKRMLVELTATASNDCGTPVGSVKGLIGD